MAGNDELYHYRFPKSLSEQRRIFGLPMDEVVPVIAIISYGLWANKPIFGIIAAALIWVITRKIKRGKGSKWLFNMIYWYLPTAIFRPFIKHITDSCFRQWTK